jgi:hypothetical protein
MRPVKCPLSGRPQFQDEWRSEDGVARRVKQRLERIIASGGFHRTMNFRWNAKIQANFASLLPSRLHSPFEHLNDPERRFSKVDSRWVDHQNRPQDERELQAAPLKDGRHSKQSGEVHYATYLTL